jgi:mannose/cellobiose epimerase-like protein (N-acyl-D-glucosamine 2-epimerase family)
LGNSGIVPPAAHNWLTDYALPTWAAVGYDSATASFIERLSITGEPLIDHPRRLMTQARQIFVYTCAHANGWFDGADEIVEQAFDSMTRRYFERDGRPGWVFSCNAAGEVVDPKRDFYGLAFALLACASRARVGDGAEALDLADRTLSFLDSAMASPYGGYVECWPESVLPRRQNPHMHLLEALLELHEVCPDRGYLMRAAKLIDLFQQRFLQAGGQCLGEFFEDNWQPRNPALSFEPGHHFEWVWLLYRYRQAGGRDLADSAAKLLDAGGKAFSADGRLKDEINIAGHSVAPTTRLWPLTEAMKALALSGSLPDPSRCWDVLFQHFLQPAPAGCWHDHLSAEGELLIDFIPASSLYHICCALDFLAKLERR